ncbi:MAG: hypothetical protein NTX17_05300 [Candidatus Eisenbacteria bacterium]|nr:hypothetical protein [Candidatus Eisenbacteria bacterium]
MRNAVLLCVALFVATWSLGAAAARGYEEGRIDDIGFAISRIDDIGFSSRVPVASSQNEGRIDDIGFARPRIDDIGFASKIPVIRGARAFNWDPVVAFLKLIAQGVAF